MLRHTKLCTGIVAFGIYNMREIVYTLSIAKARRRISIERLTS